MVSISRLPKPYFALACILSISALFILTSQHDASRQALVGIVDRVKIKTGGYGNRSGAGAGAAWTEEELAMREWELRRAIQHQGTSARMQAFIDKARSGQPFTVSVIGGSVSKGRGLPPPRHRRRSTTTRNVRNIDTDTKLGDNTDITEIPLPNVAASSSTSTKAAVGGLGASTLYSPENLHVMIFDYLNETFPHPENRFVNGAQGGVGAGYFGWCFKEHVPEDSDLVLVELGINDLLEIESISTYEHLLRGVLELETRPAIINIETFTTLFPSLISSSTFHLDVLQFYDIPSIAIRDVLLPRLLADPERQMPRWFRTGNDVTLGDPKVREFGGIAVDVMHISALGHGLVAGLVIRYLDEQIERNLLDPRFGQSSGGSGPFGLLSSSPKRKATLRVMDIPAASLTGSWNPYEPHIKHTPICRSENSASLHGLVSTEIDDFSEGEYMGLNPKEGSHGWTQWAWQEKRYLIAKNPGSLVMFDFVISPPVTIELSEEDEAAQLIAEHLDDEVELLDVDILDELSESKRRASSRRWTKSKRQKIGAGAGGSILIGYQRSAKLGLGSVLCWVDEGKSEGTRVDGWWKLDKRNMGMVKEIANNLQPGKHTLSCEIQEETLDPGGGTEFRMFAVMHD